PKCGGQGKGAAPRERGLVWRGWGRGGAIAPGGGGCAGKRLRLGGVGVGGCNVWRRRAGSNRRIAVLQTAPLATWVRRLVERDYNRIAPAGSNLPDEGDVLLR